MNFEITVRPVSLNVYSGVVRLLEGALRELVKREGCQVKGPCHYEGEMAASFRIGPCSQQILPSHFRRWAEVASVEVREVA